MHVRVMQLGKMDPRVRVVQNRRFKKQNDHTEEKFETTIRFCPLSVFSEGYDSRPAWEDWSIWKGKSGEPYDPSGPINCDILVCLLERGFPEALKAQSQPQTGRQASSRARADVASPESKKRHKKRSYPSNETDHERHEQSTGRKHSSSGQTATVAGEPPPSKRPRLQQGETVDLRVRPHQIYPMMSSGETSCENSHQRAFSFVDLTMEDIDARKTENDAKLTASAAPRSSTRFASLPNAITTSAEEPCAERFQRKLGTPPSMLPARAAGRAALARANAVAQTPKKRSTDEERAFSTNSRADRKGQGTDIKVINLSKL